MPMSGSPRRCRLHYQCSWRLRRTADKRGKEPHMTETTETAPASGASAPSGRKGGLNAMLLPELKQLAGGLGIKATGMRKGDLIEAIKAAQSGGQSGGQ